LRSPAGCLILCSLTFCHPSQVLFVLWVLHRFFHISQSYMIIFVFHHYSVEIRWISCCLVSPLLSRYRFWKYVVHVSGITVFICIFLFIGSFVLRIQIFFYLDLHIDHTPYRWWTFPNILLSSFLSFDWLLWLTFLPLCLS